MFKRILLFLILVSFLSGCLCQSSAKGPTAIKIGSVNITADSFENAFKNSPFATDDSAASRKKFLDNYIMRILILKEAEKTGLAKDPEFLQSVELFWQQSLIKLMLDKKIKEISFSVRVTDKEIGDYYKEHKEAGFKDSVLGQVHEKIKWTILNKKQTEAMDAWLGSLKNSSKVDINYNILKIEK